jgi:hypothetical protein
MIWCRRYKTFFFVTDSMSKYAEVFVPGKILRVEHLTVVWVGPISFGKNLD